MMKKLLLGGVLFIVLAVVLLASSVKRQPPHPQIAMSDFSRLLSDNRVAWVEVLTDELAGELHRDERVGEVPVKRFRVLLPQGTTGNWQFSTWLMTNAGGATVRASRAQDLLRTMLVPLIPWVLVFGFIWFGAFRQVRQAAKDRATAEPLRVYVVNPPGDPPPPMPGAGGAV